MSISIEHLSEMSPQKKYGTHKKQYTHTQKFFRFIIDFDNIFPALTYLENDSRRKFPAIIGSVHCNSSTAPKEGEARQNKSDFVPTQNPHYFQPL